MSKLALIAGAVSLVNKLVPEKVKHTKVAQATKAVATIRNADGTVHKTKAGGWTTVAMVGMFLIFYGVFPEQGDRLINLITPFLTFGVLPL